MLNINKLKVNYYYNNKKIGLETAIFYKIRKSLFNKKYIFKIKPIYNKNSDLIK